LIKPEWKTSVSDFSQFGLIGRITAEEEQNLPGQSYAHTQNEIENYEQVGFTESGFFE
jgi:hypothetical protein